MTDQPRPEPNDQDVASAGQAEPAAAADATAATEGSEDAVVTQTDESVAALASAVIASRTGEAEGESKSRWPIVLVTLATVLAIVSTVTTWVRTQALDTDEWVKLSDQLLDDENVQEALTVYLSDQLFASTDVTEAVQETIPEDLGFLAAPVAGALRGLATEAVGVLIKSDVFSDAWSAANRRAHETLVAILRDETGPNVSTADGEVTLDLRGIVIELGGNLGISEDTLENIPEDIGVVTIFQSDTLEQAQDVVRVLDFMSWFLFVIVVGLYALAVFLARGRRVTMTRNVGISLIVAGVLLLLFRSIAARLAVDAMVRKPSNEELAESVLTIATDLIRQMGWTGVLYGVLIVLVASLLGERRWAVAARRFLAPMTNGPAVAVVAGTIVLILVFLWWNPGGALSRAVTIITVSVLIAIAVYALRRQTMREFPEMTFGDAVAAVKS
ncbi:MAG: hypothetical protein QNM02_14795 [Acidimicrobiia bacterium]|nr:hypothetical protein [Acidimicrobiia bacterium]